MKSGFVTIVGKPNAGKSTLLNYIIGHKVSIATHKQNTTRNQIKGIYNDKDSQIVFVDTPGFIKAKTRLDEDMHQRILDSLKGVDVILYLLPFWRRLDEDYLKTIEITKNSSAKKFLILTKIDKANTREEIFMAGERLKDNKFFDEIIPVSSFKNQNIETVINEIKKVLKDDVAYYDKNTSHEYSDQFYVAEIIREKALFNLENEIPHHLFVAIEEFDINKERVFVRAEIIIDRDNLKRIVVGKDASKIKIIGQKAREELERYFGKKVFVETFVKVRKDWQNKDSIIKSI